jgi:hypothetical protein
MESATNALKNSGSTVVLSVNAIVGIVVGVVCVIGASVFIGYKASQSRKPTVSVDDTSYTAM